MPPLVRAETYGTLTGDLRPYVSNPLGKYHRHTGTGDLRVPYATEASAARVGECAVSAHHPPPHAYRDVD